MTFLLMYYMGFGYTEAVNVSLARRRWFIERVNKEFESAKEAGKDPVSKAPHDNTPDQRQMQGRARDAVPAKLIRFT